MAVPTGTNATDAMYTAFYVGGFFGFSSRALYALSHAAIHVGAPGSSSTSFAESRVASIPRALRRDRLRFVRVHRWAHANRFLWLFTGSTTRSASDAADELPSTRRHRLPRLLQAVPVAMLARTSRGSSGDLDETPESPAHSDFDWGTVRLDSSSSARAFTGSTMPPSRARPKELRVPLAVWDHVFGRRTAGRSTARYGVEGRPSRVRFLPQQIDPSVPRFARSGGRQAMNQAKLQLLYSRAYQDLAAAQSAALVAIGSRLGLYEALAAPGRFPNWRRRRGERALPRAVAREPAGLAFVTKEAESGRHLLDEEQREIFRPTGSPHALAARSSSRRSSAGTSRGRDRDACRNGSSAASWTTVHAAIGASIPQGRASSDGCRPIAGRY